jgi:ribonuclease BN (tRNA processing enzyme)
VSSLDFFVLGSGCYAPGANPSSVRNPSGYALRRGDEILIFDLGFGNFRQMVRAGLDPNQVSNVFISHRHPDHLGDLPALLFYYRYDGKPRRKKLHLYGPRGFKNFMKHLAKAHYPWLRPREFQLSVSELEEPAIVKSGGWRVQCREVPHTTEALAFRFDSSDGSVCYSGDTAYDAGLAAFAAQSDLFVLECTLGDKERVEGHMRVSEALDLAERSQARRVVLTHLSTAAEKGLSRRLAGRKGISKAKDLQRIILSRP